MPAAVLPVENDPKIADACRQPGEQGDQVANSALAPANRTVFLSDIEEFDVPGFHPDCPASAMPAVAEIQKCYGQDIKAFELDDEPVLLQRFGYQREPLGGDKYERKRNEQIIGNDAQ